VLVRRWALVLGGIATIVVLFVFASDPGGRSSPPAVPSSGTGTTSTVSQAASTTPAGLPGMPPVLNPNDIYAADRPGALSPVVKNFPQLVYVPNSESNTVSVIDPTTYKVLNTFPVGGLPQHVVPSWDLRTLWVTNDQGNSLTPVDPATGKPGAPVPVEDPYNMYFTPDGRYSIVVAEALKRLDFRDAHTMQLVHSLPVPCEGADHADFSADGTYMIVSCEFSSQMLKVDVAHQQLVGTLTIPGSSPQDVKTSPDGKVFYEADLKANGLYEIDGSSFRVIGFIPTGKGAHGLYVSRDSRYMYVSNRGEGSVSLVDLSSRSVATTWHIPGGGSPDMGGVSADGRVLWLTGRYNSDVYAIDTTSGQLLARIPVGHGPHGLSVYPQPGRYSLGHTGVFR
jgi:YVTN family beta-propeller protein